MISPEKLASALERLDSSDREVLDFSLRRRVPDEALAKLLDCEPPEVARRRAAAIERLSDALGVERGQDLGAVLKELLEPETWAAMDSLTPESVPAPSGGPPPKGALTRPPGESGTGAEQGENEPAGGRAGVETVTPGGNGADGVPPADSEPVLDMLAQRPPTPAQEQRRPVRWMLAGGLGAVALIVAAGLGGALLFDDEDSADQEAAGSQTRHFVPQQGGPLAAPFPSDRAALAGYLTATVRRPTVLYERPGGRRKLRLPARTEWRSPRVLSVVEQRGRWLAVLAPELRNGEVGWLRAGQARLGSVRWSLHVDLSKRLLRVRKNGRTVRKITVAIGSEGNPTPTGRFAVTDKLRVSDGSSPYGCCVLALTGHQTRLPTDWPGGDRLAVHATNDTGSIGKRVSLGCMRAASSQARWLIETAPLGAPIFIRS